MVLGVWPKPLIESIQPAIAVNVFHDPAGTYFAQPEPALFENFPAQADGNIRAPSASERVINLGNNGHHAS